MMLLFIILGTTAVAAGSTDCLDWVAATNTTAFVGVRIPWDPTYGLCRGRDDKTPASLRPIYDHHSCCTPSSCYDTFEVAVPRLNWPSLVWYQTKIPSDTVYSMPFAQSGRFAIVYDKPVNTWPGIFNGTTLTAPVNGTHYVAMCGAPLSDFQSSNVLYTSRFLASRTLLQRKSDSTSWLFQGLSITGDLFVSQDLTSQSMVPATLLFLGNGEGKVDACQLLLPQIALVVTNSSTAINSTEFNNTVHCHPDRDTYLVVESGTSPQTFISIFLDISDGTTLTAHQIRAIIVECLGRSFGGFSAGGYTDIRYMTSYDGILHLIHSDMKGWRMQGPQIDNPFDVPDSSTKSYNTTAMFALLNATRDTTVRGVPLYYILQKLIAPHDGITPEYPVAIVGGAVRNILLGIPANDIDIAIGMPYPMVETEVKKAFSSFGVALDQSAIDASGKRQQYGMLKVHPLNGESEGLDIGPFKSRISGPYERDLPEGYIPERDVAGNQYVYALDYVADAKFRDYTLNAVYMQFNPPVIIDPLTTGVASLFARVLCPCNFRYFDYDLGGHFRFWKMMTAANPYTEGSPSSSPPCNVGWNGDNRPLATRTCERLSYYASLAANSGEWMRTFFIKMQKKLSSDVGEAITSFRNAICNSNLVPCGEFWTTLVSTAQLAAQTLLSQLPGENPVTLRVAQLLSAITSSGDCNSDQARTSSGARQRRLVEPERLEEDLSQMDVSNDTLFAFANYLSLYTTAYTDFTISPPEEPLGGYGAPYTIYIPVESDIIVTNGSAGLFTSKAFLSLIYSNTIPDGPASQATRQLSGQNNTYVSGAWVFSTVTVTGGPLTEDFRQNLYCNPSAIARFASNVARLDDFEFSDSMFDAQLAASPDPVPTFTFILRARVARERWGNFSLDRVPNGSPLVIQTARGPLSASTVVMRSFLNWVYTGSAPDPSNPLYSQLKYIADIALLTRKQAWPNSCPL